MPSDLRSPWKPTHVSTPDGAVLRAFVTEPAGASAETPTILLAHGWTLDHRSWDRVADLLVADGGARIISYDQRGHGGSTLAGGRFRTGEESVGALGDDMAEVIKALVPSRSPLVLAGHSMGGMTVMALAGLHPHMVRERVCAVVLVATSAGQLTGAGVPGEALAMKMAAKLPLKPRGIIRASSQSRTSFGPHADAADVAAVCEQIGGTRLSTMGAFYGALTRHDEVAALANLGNVPVWILVGSKDRLTPPKHAGLLAEAIPNAELITVPNAGHMLMYEATETVTSAIRQGLAATSAVDDHTV